MRPYRDLTATFDLEHLSELSDQTSLWLNVSPRTLYLLQNIAAEDICNHLRYFVDRTNEGYIPLSDSDSDQFDLYLDVLENAQAEIVETEPPTMPDLQQMSYIRAHCMSGSFPHGEFKIIQYDVKTEDRLDELDDIDFSFVAAYPGLRLFEASITFAQSTAWDNWNDIVDMVLMNFEHTVWISLLNKRHVNVDGSNKYISLFGSCVHYLDEAEAVHIMLRQRSGVTQYPWVNATYAPSYSRLMIVGLADYAPIGP